MSKQQQGTTSGRFSAQRKSAAVMRLFRGEDLELLSREYGVTAARLSQWREGFMAAGQLGLQERPSDEREEQLGRLQAKVGELTMTKELLEHKIAQLERGLPFARRRSKP